MPVYINTKTGDKYDSEDLSAIFPKDFAGSHWQSEGYQRFLKLSEIAGGMVAKTKDVEKQDMKAALGNKKPPLCHVPVALLNYAARAHQYGAEKYVLGNYLRPPAEGLSDVARLLEYISATQRHLAAWTDSIIRHLGGGRQAVDNLNDACFAEDMDTSEGSGSHLPHAAHAAASLGMALQQAADAGLMPIDPTPKRK
jgi:hypothetical protein